MKSDLHISPVRSFEPCSQLRWCQLHNNHMVPFSLICTDRVVTCQVPLSWRERVKLHVMFRLSMYTEVTGLPVLKQIVYNRNPVSEHKQVQCVFINTEM